MSAIINALKAASIDLVGLGFAGTALFLAVTGHVAEPGFGVCVGIAGTYLGLKIPTAPGQP